MLLSFLFEAGQGLLAVLTGGDSRGSLLARVVDYGAGNKRGYAARFIASGAQAT